MNSTGPKPAGPTLDSAPAGLRGDLVQTEQNYLGRKYIIFKNPIGLSYYRLPVSHAAAAAKFDGRRKFRDILQELRSTDRYWRSLREDRASRELFLLAQQLASSGLMRVSGGSAVARARHIKQIKKKHHFETSFSKILYFRKSLIDPDHLLEKMLPYFGWIYTKPASIAAGIFCLATLVMAFRNWDEITTHAANFFTFENLALSWVSFFGVKIVHEFGHGLTCKRFGGEVHEMGFMFILFTPYLFCNVSDSWLTTKAHRIMVTAAGISVELVMASIAAWLWLGSQPGLFHQMCFNTMFLCSVTTILFNANPLMKFDGYYIMTDMLEIPNLRQKSNTYITQWAQRTLLGIKTQKAGVAGFEQNPWFGVYAVLAYLYGWLILYRISFHLFDALKPYNLEILSRSYVVMFLFVSLALPFYRLASSVKNTPEIRRQLAPRFRVIALCALVGAAVLFVIPWQDTIKRNVVVEHGGKDQIVLTDPGFLRAVYVRDGQKVKKGEVIGRFENEELSAEKTDLELQKAGSEVQYRAAISSDRVELQEMASAHQKVTQEITAQIKGIDEKIDKMTLRAPANGVIRGRQLESLEGQFFNKERVLCEVGETDRMRAIIALNEREARRIRIGQEVRFRLFALPGSVFEGKVTSLPVSPQVRFSSPVMANLFGGDVPAEMDLQSPVHDVKPSIPYYEAEVIFDEGSLNLRPGMMGKARIYAGKTTLGMWVVERVFSWIDPEMRL